MKLHHCLFTIALTLGLSLTLASAARAQEMMQVDTVPAWIDPIARQSLSSAWGDFDGDGDLDLVIGTLNDGVHLWTNVDGTFPAAVNIGDDQYPNPAVLHGWPLPPPPDFGDLGGVVVVDAASEKAPMALGNEAVSIGDLNGDGRLDIVVASGRPLYFPSNHTQQPNQIFINHTETGGPIKLRVADVTWNNWPANITGPMPTSDVALADIDRDGMLDIAFADRGWVRVYLNRTVRGADEIVLDMMGNSNACEADPLIFKIFDYVKLDNVSTAAELVITLREMSLQDGSTATMFFNREFYADKSVMQALFDEQGPRREQMTTIINNYLVGDIVETESDALEMNFEDFANKLADIKLIELLGDTGVEFENLLDNGDLDDLPGSSLFEYVEDDEAAHLMDLLELFAPRLLSSPPKASEESVDNPLLPEEPSPDPQLFIDAKRIDFGHLDGDGFPDLAAVVGNNTIRIWSNIDGCYRAQGSSGAVQGVADTIYTNQPPSAIAWGDATGDGLDELGIAYDGRKNEVLLNAGGNLAGPIWFGKENRRSVDLDWGDADGDGDLDLAVANTGTDVNAIYLNDPSQDNAEILGSEPAWEDTQSRLMSDVHWGDIDNDGDLDLASAIYTEPDMVYWNRNPSLATGVYSMGLDFDFVPQSAIDESGGFAKDGNVNFASGAIAGWDIGGDLINANSLAWGDADNDGDLDLAIGNAVWNDPGGNPPQNIDFQMMDSAPDVVLENQGGWLSPTPLWQSPPYTTTSVAWGDMNGDGKLDLATGSQGGLVAVYVNEGVYENDEGRRLNLSPNCLIDIRDRQIYQRLLESTEVGVLATLRANPELLVAVKADDDALGRTIANLIAEDEVLDSDHADSHLLAAVYNDPTLMRDISVALIEHFNLDPSMAPVQTQTDPVKFMEDWLPLLAWDGEILRELLSDDDLLNLEVTALSETDLLWASTYGHVTDVAWGDVNSDGYLDLVVGIYGGANRLYLFDPVTSDSTEQCPLVLSEWLPVTATTPAPGQNVLQQIHLANTYSVAFADVDNDGDLDLAVGNHTGAAEGDANHDILYLNRDGMLDDFPSQTIGAKPRTTRSLAWGDMDGDGDQDLAVGVWSGHRVVFANVDGILQPNPIWESAETAPTNSVAWGDADGDGDLDLAASSLTLFTGGAVNGLYYNQRGVLDHSSSWPVGGVLDTRNTNDVAWADVDGDGLLDLATANQSIWDYSEAENRSYRRAPITLHSGLRPRQIQSARADPRVVIYAADVDYGDVLTWDSDFFGFDYSDPDVTIETLAPADYFARSQITDTNVISITYRVLDPNNRPVHRIEAFYSFNGTDWQPAIASSTTVTENLATGFQYSPGEAPIHEFGWVLQDPRSREWLFGQVQDTRFRIVAYPALESTQGDIAGSFQQGYSAAQTFPFPVNGTQVQVFQADGSQAEGAFVFRMPAGQVQDAAIISSDSGEPYRTSSGGLISGRGELAKGDKLMALLPISATHAYELYLTSGTPNEISVDMQRVSAPGLIPITVTKANPLYLFNLDVSLEWDASADIEFLSRLETAFKNASAILFDVTDGQVALGEIRVHNAKEAWTWADIVIYASNSVRPRATMGGIVYEPTVDSDMIPKAGRDELPPMYVPGQIHMGTFWDPFGQSQLELQQDWQRALAHELGHYLLFLPDNYLGIRNGLLTTVDCQGSVMTNAYDEDSYGELLTAAQWDNSDENPDCQLTVAETMLTGRSDWETVEKFLPAIHPPAADDTNQGPSILPLDITRVLLPSVDSLSSARYLLPRNFDLRDEQGNLTPVREGEAYLYKMGLRRGREPRPVTEIIPLGSTGSGRDRLKVRGASPGDRLCVFDSNSRLPRVACIEALTRSVQSLSLEPVEGWAPDITVTPVTSRTVAISVTQVVTGSNLMIQVVPAYGPPTMPHVINAPVAVTMDPVRSSDIVTESQLIDGSEVITQWTKVITIAHPSFEGFVRVYEEVASGDAPHETVTQYFLSAGWNPNTRLGTGGGANTYPWGPNTRLGTGGGTNTRLGTGGGTNTRLGTGGGTNTRLGTGGGTNTRLGTGGGTNTRLGTGGGTNTRLGTGGGTNTRLGTGGGTNVRAWGAHQRTLEAPIASGDGHVTLFNLDDILADMGAASLQAMSAPPTLDPWLTAVGRAYRLNLVESANATAPIEYTLAFQYLEREVPPGYESVLRIYHLPDGEDQWQALDTHIDPGANLAAAPIPESPNGVYALIATVELPPMAPGWNILAYTIPQTRTVASALESLAGHYATVRHYDPVSEPSWRVFDPTYGQKAADLPYAANSLDALEFGNSYLVYIAGTDVITPYLRISDVVNGTQRGKPGQAANSGETVNALGNNVGVEGFGIFNATGGQLTVAPAHFFGEVILPSQIDPDAEATVRAKVGDQVCGETTVTKLDSGVCVYMLDVVSDGAANGCGTVGRQVTFELQTDGHSWSVGDSAWENRSVQRLDLIPSHP